MSSTLMSATVNMLLHTNTMDTPINTNIVGRHGQLKIQKLLRIIYDSYSLYLIQREIERV